MTSLVRAHRSRRGGCVALAAIAVVSISAVRAPWPVDRAGAAVQPMAKLVRVGFPAYDGTLTPYTFTLGYPLVTLIYDTLLWRDAQGIPQPWLARSVASSDGGRRLTVQLRGGVRWQDGRPLTAADVAFTFRFVASHYQPRFTQELRDVQDVRVMGPLTVVIGLRHVSLGFDAQPLADMPILPEHVWRGLAAGRIAPPGLPVGSGPYRLVSADPKTGYVFRANRGYFEGRPLVEEIQVLVPSRPGTLGNGSGRCHRRARDAPRLLVGLGDHSRECPIGRGARGRRDRRSDGATPAEGAERSALARAIRSIAALR